MFAQIASSSSRHGACIGKRIPAIVSEFLSQQSSAREVGRHPSLCTIKNTARGRRSCMPLVRVRPSTAQKLRPLAIYCTHMACSPCARLSACSSLRPCAIGPHPDAHEQATPERFNTSRGSLLTRPSFARCTVVMRMERTRISLAVASQGTVVMRKRAFGAEDFFKEKKNLPVTVTGVSGHTHPVLFRDSPASFVVDGLHWPWCFHRQ